VPIGSATLDDVEQIVGEYAAMRKKIVVESHERGQHGLEEHVQFESLAGATRGSMMLSPVRFRTGRKTLKGATREGSCAL
jgi:hypothetical protein